MDLINPTGRIIAVLTLLGCAGTIAWLIAFGEPWSYFLALGILAAFGMGAGR